MAFFYDEKNEKSTKAFPKVLDKPKRKRKRTGETQPIPREVLEQVEKNKSPSRFVSYKLTDKENLFIAKQAAKKNITFQQSYEMTIRDALKMFMVAVKSIEG